MRLAMVAVCAGLDFALGSHSASQHRPGCFKMKGMSLTETILNFSAPVGTGSLAWRSSSSVTASFFLKIASRFHNSGMRVA